MNVALALRVVAAAPFSRHARNCLRALRSSWEPWVGPQQKKVEWGDLFDDDPPITFPNCRQKLGNTSLTELAVLRHLIEVYSLRKVFEIDTYDGMGTLNLAMATGPGGRVTTINLPEEKAAEHFLHKMFGEKTGWRFHGRPEEQWITQLLADSHEFDPGPMAGTFSLVFIDGDHSEEGAYADSLLAHRLVRHEGTAIIAWHDWQLGRVRAAAQRFLGAWKECAPVMVFQSTRLAFMAFVDGQPASWEMFRGHGVRG